MTPNDIISIDGVPTPAAAMYDPTEYCRGGYIRQDIQVAGRRPMHLNEHLALIRRSFETLYGIRPQLPPATVAAWCTELLDLNGYPDSSIRISILAAPYRSDGQIRLRTTLIAREIMLETGYHIRAIRPRAVIEHYGLPYPSLPFSAAFESDAAARLRRNITGSNIVLRADSTGQLLAAGTAALFAVEGRTVITSPTTAGAPDSVERRLTIEAVNRAGIAFEERPLTEERLGRYDELFFSDCRGLTSISECGENTYMSLMVDRIIRQMR